MTRKRKAIGKRVDTVPSQRALSRRLRVSRSTIDRLVKDGLQADKNGEYSVAQAEELQRVRALRMRDAATEGEKRREGALQLKESRLRVDLEMAAHKLAVAKGEVISRTAVGIEWRRAVVTVKNRLLSLGRECAPLVVGKGPQEAKAIIDRKVFEALRALAHQQFAPDGETSDDPSQHQGGHA